MNTNCLKGMKCPECESEPPFKIVCIGLFMVHDTGSDSDDFLGDLEWDEDAYCGCYDCGYSGLVKDFRRCTACEDLGFILADPNSHGDLAIQRCDACDKFKDDNEAVQEAFRLVKEHC